MSGKTDVIDCLVASSCYCGACIRVIGYETHDSGVDATNTEGKFEFKCIVHLERIMDSEKSCLKGENVSNNCLARHCWFPTMDYHGIFTMWFDQIGSDIVHLSSFDHNYTATLLSLIATGCALGSLFGGVVADRMAHIYPHSGGIMCAHFTAFIDIPFFWFLLNYVVASVPKTFVLMIMESNSLFSV